MGKPRFKTIRLLFKLMLLLQIYFRHKLPVAEATENSSSENFDKCTVGDQTDSNDQKPEKETAESVLERPKRPARLLPLKMILGEEKNITNTRFYGPATSCEELLKIGYTRNGFYLVKGNATSNNSNVEVVECLFRNPSGVKEVKEKRIGLIIFNPNLNKIQQRRSIETFKEFGVNTIMNEIDLERSKRPGRLLPLQLLYGREKNSTEVQNIPKPFYGPPTNCIDLGKLGYTLNGYYLVNGAKIKNQIEVVLCRFQLPPQENEAAKEELLGFISLHQNEAVTGQLKSTDKGTEGAEKETSTSVVARKKRPARLIPLQLLFDGEEKNNTKKQDVQQLNSNPANCDDIRKLKYTLNGYYLVNSSDISGRFSVFFCQFKLPPGASKNLFGDRIGLIHFFYDDIMSNGHSQTYTENGLFEISSTDDTYNTLPNEKTSSSTSTETTSLTAIVVKDNNVDDSNNCLPAFYLRDIIDKLCLQESNGKGARGHFYLNNCNQINPEQEWVKIVSKYDPDIIQICHFHDHLICLTATNETEDGARFSYVFLTKYHNFSQATQTQLWKMKKDSGQILNYAESSLCLGHISTPFDQKPPFILGMFVIAPCADEISSITKEWTFKPITDESNSQKCVDIPPQQNPIESVTVVNHNIKYLLNCHPHFFFKEYSFDEYCLQLKYSEKENFNFVWSLCDINQPEQRWLNVGSKNIPGSIQICQAYGEKKCFMDNSGTISLDGYRSKLENSPARLWKMNSKGQLVNVHSGLCLHGFEIKNKNLETENKYKYLGKILPLSTKKCADLTKRHQTGWFFEPIFDYEGHRICIDVRTPEKNLIENSKSQTNPSNDVQIPKNILIENNPKSQKNAKNASIREQTSTGLTISNSQGVNTKNPPEYNMPNFGKSATKSNCRHAFLLKNVDRGKTECLGIRRSHPTLKGSNEKASSIGWFSCNHSNLALAWIMPATQIENSYDPYAIKIPPQHICQIIEDGPIKECLTISNRRPSKTVGQPAIAEIHSIPISLKDKMQAWDVDIIPESNGSGYFFQFVNAGLRGFCLGSNSIKPLQGSLIGRDQLFAEMKCSGNSKVQWNMEKILENGQIKCVNDYE